MVDLGEVAARRGVTSSAQEQAGVFAGHRARVQAMEDLTVHNSRLLMQDTNRGLFGWFLSRADARHTLRRALGLTG